MYFTSGSDRAFEQLMQGKPGFDHYDSGEAVTPEDCGTCRFYRPHWKYQFCVYAECPYQPGKLTAYDAVTFRVKGVENMAVFRVERNKGYTVMSNHHLRNKDLSLKAKGLLSQMLSLPEDWDYTLKGLSLLSTGSRSTRSGRLSGSWNRRAISCVPVSVTAKAACAGRITSFTNSPSLCRIHLHWKIQHWIIQRRKSLRRKNQRN